MAGHARASSSYLARAHNHAKLISLDVDVQQCGTKKAHHALSERENDDLPRLSVHRGAPDGRRGRPPPEPLSTPRVAAPSVRR
eukprot:413716-Prymnesium_polylepis.2